MPWHVGKSDSCPPSKPYAVIKDADGSVAGCHETRKKAEAQMAALYANDENKAWSSSYITDLPDSAFACIDSSGRHYPHHDAAGKLDLPHLRNALSRLGQSDTTSCGAEHLRAHAKAQGVGKSEEMLTIEPMKAERLTTTKWRVLAIPFVGRPKDGRDTDGEFFSPRTDIKADWFDRRPLIWHHGLDSTMKAEPELGIEDDLEMEPDGWWATAWLNRAHRYWSRIDKWLQEGKVYGSSGTLSHFARKDHKTGELLVWPHIEQTLTLTPANPFARLKPAKAWDDFTSAGIAVDEATRLLFAEPDSLTDLGPDLPIEGGEDPAMKLAAALDDYVKEVRKRLE